MILKCTKLSACANMHANIRFRKIPSQNMGQFYGFIRK